jgi:hypothetical protein
MPIRIGSSRKITRLRIWRNRSNVRSAKRFVGFHEGAEEVLASADYSGDALVGYAHCCGTGFSRSPIHLHTILSR